MNEMRTTLQLGTYFNIFLLIARPGVKGTEYRSRLHSIFRVMLRTRRFAARTRKVMI